MRIGYMPKMYLHCWGGPCLPIPPEEHKVPGRYCHSVTEMPAGIRVDFLSVTEPFSLDSWGGGGAGRRNGDYYAQSIRCR